MPLRDHFRPPLDDRRSWEELHSGWPMMIVLSLGRKLPRRYIAVPGVHAGVTAEIDVATFEPDDADTSLLEGGNGQGGVATAAWAPAKPSLVIATDLPALAEYEIRIYDSKRGRRLVAAIEIVSPSNKDREEHRWAFVAKCAALLQQRVAVTIVDLVTTRNFNLYHELLEHIGTTDPALGTEPPPTYAVSCRATRTGEKWFVETWAKVLSLGQPMPTLPVWLADNLAVPLELEASYEETCKALRITA